jgi:hypothetical protein
MVKGAANYAPSAKFAFPRSYVRGFCVRVNAPVTFTTNKAIFFDAGNPNIRYTIETDIRFYNWSSNRYTLDFIITESYYQTLPNVAKTAVPYRVTWIISPVNKSVYLEYLPYSAAFIPRYYTDYPPAPPSYWKPTF